MPTIRTGSRLLIGAGALIIGGCAVADATYRTRSPDAEWMHEAMARLTDVIIHDIFSPPQATRAYAYASIAAYEAIRQDHPDHRTLAGRLNGLTPVPPPDSAVEYYFPLAGVHAFMTVGKSLTFSQDRMDSLRADLHARIRRLDIPEAVYERSIAYGDTIAKHVLAWAGKDNYLQTRGYPKFTVTSEPGRWRPTPPAYMDAVEPHWATHRPFTLDSASQFRPGPPHPFDMTEGSAFQRQVREVYEVGKRLTDEQRAIAAFWDCNPYVMHVRGHAMFATKKMSPGGHWMGIAAIAARKTDASLVRAAETYARTAIALADGFISNWDEKYRSTLVRPETVINAHLDESWQPLLQTPPFPEYTSGHSVISNAAAAVLTDLYGPDFAFEDDTETPYGLPVRSYASFTAAASEAAISRLYGGIHYRMAVEEGVTQGRRVGEHVVQRLRTRATIVAVRPGTPDGASASAERPAH